MVDRILGISKSNRTVTTHRKHSGKYENCKPHTCNFLPKNVAFFIDKDLISYQNLSLNLIHALGKAILVSFPPAVRLLAKQKLCIHSQVV